MRLLLITFAAFAAAFGTSSGLKMLYPETEAVVDPDSQPVTVEQVFDTALEPAPMPAGSRLLRVGDIDIDVTPPEQGRLSEDLDESNNVAERDTTGLTEEALQLAALAEANDGTMDAAEAAEVSDVDAIEETAAASEAEVTPTPPSAKAASRSASDTDMSAGANLPTIAPTAAARTNGTPDVSEVRDAAQRDDDEATAESVQDELPRSTPRPLAATQLPSTRALTEDTIVTVPDNSNVPRSSAPPSAPQQTARPTATPPRPTAAAPRATGNEPEPEAWWSRPTTSEQLGVIHVGTAGFNRAIVLMTDGGFTSVRSVASNVEILRNGIVVPGEWTISPANNHLLIFQLADAGRYDITIGAGLQDRNGRPWPHTVRGSVDVP